MSLLREAGKQGLGSVSRLLGILLLFGVASAGGEPNAVPSVLSFAKPRHGDFLWSTDGLTPAALGLLKIQRRKIIAHRFGPADHADVAVWFEQVFGAAEFAVVLETHRVTMRTGIVQDQQVADVHFGQ